MKKTNKKPLEKKTIPKKRTVSSIMKVKEYQEEKNIGHIPITATTHVFEWCNNNESLFFPRFRGYAGARYFHELTSIHIHETWHRTIRLHFLRQRQQQSHLHPTPRLPLPSLHLKPKSKASLHLFSTDKWHNTEKYQYIVDTGLLEQYFCCRIFA